MRISDWSSDVCASDLPKWDHSPQIELLVWAWPLLIIIAVGAISWIGTHQLDPYRPLTHYAKDKPVPAGVKPREVHGVSLEWKWLFFYPQYGIATVNELAAPVHRTIRLRLTSRSDGRRVGKKGVNKF